ncbi:MAG: hypothetical protein Q8N37_03835 [bacterium]|nr:hypothetical protein [bacterium]
MRGSFSASSAIAFSSDGRTKTGPIVCGSPCGEAKVGISILSFEKLIPCKQFKD